MKKFILLALFTMVSCACYAQSIKVHQGINVNSFLLSKLDSITFHRNDLLKFYYKSQVSEFLVNDVDSISISKPGYYQIPDDYLDGWDEGIVSSDNYYFVVRKVDNEEGYVAYMNDAVNSSLGLAIYYDNDFNVMEMVSEKGGLFFEWDNNNNTLLVYSIDASGEVVLSDEIDLTYGLQQAKRTKKRTGGFLSDVGNAIVGANIVNNWAGRYNTIKNFLAGDWDSSINGLGTDIAGTLIGGAIGGVPGAIIELGIGECFNILNNRLKELDEKGVKLLLGDSQIQITNIKRTGIYSYKVTVSITGLDTRPTGSHWNNKQVDVKAGIYIRENYPTVTYNYKTSESTLYPINSDGPLNIDITIEKPRGRYYIAPVLIPYSYGYPHTSNIRYGSSKLLEGEVVQISNIKQDRCTYYKSSMEYAVEVSIDADIISLEGITSWGVEIYSLAMDLGENKIIEAPSGTSSHTFKYQDFLSETSLDKTTNSFKLNAIPYVIGKSNDDKVYGKAKSFEIKAMNLCPDDNHPHAIDLGLRSRTKWCCCNVGASSPEEYGGYFAWGETSEKSVYSDVTYEYFNGQDTDGDGEIDQNFSVVNIGSNIAGSTRYDAATVNMGAPWRMPSKTQIVELYEYCSSREITLNGVNGQLLTGPNGGKVFLPAAGSYEYGDGYLYGENFSGECWSSTLNTSYPSCAYSLSIIGWGWGYTDRAIGMSVRAVRP